MPSSSTPSGPRTRKGRRAGRAWEERSEAGMSTLHPRSVDRHAATQSAEEDRGSGAGAHMSGVIRKTQMFAACSIVAVIGASLSVLAAAPQTASSDARADPALIADLVAANRILAQENIFDGFGHVSARDGRNPNRYYLARSLAPGLVAAGDILEFDLDSNAVNAKGTAVYSERFIHGEIYKARPDVKAIVHNHSPALIPFSVSAVPLRPVSHTAGFIEDRVPVFDIRTSAGMTDMLVSNADRARALATVLGT